MRFEEVIPALRDFRMITRPAIDGQIQLLKGEDDKIILRIWRGFGINCPYDIDGEDLFADDWIIL